MGVGSRLKEILQSKNMTLKELSEVTGISKNTLYSITKRDNTHVRIDILQRIAKELNITVNDLLHDGEMNHWVDEDGVSHDEPMAMDADDGAVSVHPPQSEAERKKMQEEFAKLPEEAQRKMLELARTMIEMQNDPDK